MIAMTDVQSNIVNDGKKKSRQYMKILKRQSTDFGE